MLVILGYLGVGWDIGKKVTGIVLIQTYRN